MIRNFAWAALLFLRLALADHAEGQTADHAAEWQARQAAYMDQPRIIKMPSALRITTNSARPLDQIVGALGGRSGWHINYEDPHYAEIDLVDSTAPRWLLQHPNGPVYTWSRATLSMSLLRFLPPAKTPLGLLSRCSPLLSKLITTAGIQDDSSCASLMAARLTLFQLLLVTVSKSPSLIP